MRYSLIFSLLIALSTSSVHAMTMTGEGIDTDHGSIKWEQLINLPKEVQSLTLQIKVLQVGLVLSVSALLYIKLFNSPKDKKADVQS